MNDENEDQIKAFLKKFKVVMNDTYEYEEDFDPEGYHYDVVVLFEGKPVLRTKWHAGRGWNSSQICGTPVLQSLFSDAEAYQSVASMDDENALPEFLEELGYLDNAKSVKKGIKAFWGCKRIWTVLSSFVLNNAAWHDEDGRENDYLWDVEQYLDNNMNECVKLVETDFDSYVDDYMKEET